MEESLNSLSQRIPNLDLKFFITAVLLQRQTGGDLAEILDNIGSLIRDRFRIWGQVQALTGEGRLSGVVLLALPLVLFVTVYQLNPKYFRDAVHRPDGQENAGLRRHHADRRRPGHPQDRQYQGIRRRDSRRHDRCSFEQLLPLALFGMFAALAWWVLGLMADKKPRAVERLGELKNPRLRRSPQPDAILKRSDPMTKVLERATPALATTAAAQERGRAEQTENEAGQREFPQRGGPRRLPGPEAGGADRRLVHRRRHGREHQGRHPQRAAHHRRAGPDLLLPARPDRGLSGQEPAARPFFSPCPTPWTSWWCASRPAWDSTRPCARSATR